MLLARRSLKGRFAAGDGPVSESKGGRGYDLSRLSFRFFT